ncbi:MAG: DUF1015 family protein [Clostridiales bacterium]|nr:DUF1015 family protein [Clostridiales bacterium]
MNVRDLVNFSSEILIPRGDVSDFAVVACDQFSSNPEYWHALSKTMPPNSALELILPECFLYEKEKRLKSISEAYGKMGADRFYPVTGTVAVTRSTAFGRTRRGIVAPINLDCYDYKTGNKALIRASERTVEDRIPPRVAIREAIGVEMPHILLLVDDKDFLIDKAVDSVKRTTLYDCDLRGGGGHIKGELITDPKPLYEACEKIISQMESKFSQSLFSLVGDGNHSLATAKHCATAKKTPLNGMALVEIENIYDEGLVFEPIHRLVKCADKKAFTDGFRAAVKGDAVTELYIPEPVTVSVPSDKVQAIIEVDKFCEDFVKKHGGDVDYVHGEDMLRRDGHIGIRMREVGRGELFGYVLDNGVLPKKTFSLGEAQEKRFYVEARKIK